MSTLAVTAVHARGERARHDRGRGRTTSIAGPVAWALALAVALAIAGALPTIGSGAPSVPAAAMVVRVAASDTLWSIAAAHPLPGHSTAWLVTEIARMNGLRSSGVHAGAVLKVPAQVAPDAAFAQVAGVNGTR